MNEKNKSMLRKRDVDVHEVLVPLHGIRVEVFVIATSAQPPPSVCL